VVDSEAATYLRADSAVAAATSVAVAVVVTSAAEVEDTPVVAATAGTDKLQTCSIL
jgi:hypothetical protein